MNNHLLVFGLFFPVVSWLSFIASRLHAIKTKRHSSAIFVPVVGPIMIDWWLVSEGASYWWLVVPWLADIGTLFFISIAPRLAGELWYTSRFTRLFRLVGARDNQAVDISFHKGGHYVLKKSWNRAKGELGVIALSEAGTYLVEGSIFVLQSHTGVIRRIRVEGEVYVVQDFDSQDSYNIQNWTLHLQC